MNNLCAERGWNVNNRRFAHSAQIYPHPRTFPPQVSRRDKAAQGCAAKGFSGLSRISVGLIYYYYI